MCGISGIVGALSPSNSEALRRMTDAIAHRGPDSAGYWTSEADDRGRGCMFGHRRLSIIDLSTAADQPMTDPNKTHTVAFNGEIYNFMDLRRELEGRGERFQSTGDTAVMLRLLALEGPAAVSKLRGMFAMGLWDERSRRLLLTRDPHGIKPLYVCQNPDPNGEWSLLFASEVRAILASGLIGRPRLDRRALASMVWNGFIVGPGTAVQGIESLLPGEVRMIDANGQRVCGKTYWRIPDATGKGTANEGDLREALVESVKGHLISDVPVGIFLSSGVDSSAVANLAQKVSESPVHTFTLGFEEQQFNEGVYARQIAKAIGTHHHEIMLTGQQFAGAVETALDTLDQPTFDGLNSYYISKAVREAGLTVALVGTGGDELFGGYPSFRALPTLVRWQRRSRLVPAGAKRTVAELARKFLSPHRSGDTPPQTRWAKLPDMASAGDDVIALYQLASALFLPDFQRDLILDHDTHGMCSGLSPELFERLRGEIDGHTTISAVSVLEQRLFLGERLLRDTDAASMAVSLETRLPLVDSVITDTVSRLGDDQRYAPVGSKQMLRKLGLEGLDPALFNRPKTGFVLPFDRWIRESLGKAMDDTMRDEQQARAVGLNGRAVSNLWAAFQSGAPGLYWSRVWAVYVFIRWCHRHHVFA